jgi:hypothetical protein
MAEKWIAWRKLDRTPMIRTEAESKPHTYGWTAGPATKEEIEQEKQRRKEKDDKEAILREFRNRQEYVLAKEIRDRLEWMTPTDHPLDRLTLDEWRELLAKIR